MSSKINALQMSIQARLINDCIGLLSEVGLNVHGLVFNGSPTNQLTARKLGCKMNVEEPTHWFIHPQQQSFRVCHIWCLSHVEVDVQPLRTLQNNCTYKKRPNIVHKMGVHWLLKQYSGRPWFQLCKQIEKEISVLGKTQNECQIGSTNLKCICRKCNWICLRLFKGDRQRQSK